MAKNELEINIEEDDGFADFLGEETDTTPVKSKAIKANITSFEIDPYSGAAQNEYGEGLEEEWLEKQTKGIQPVEVEFDEDEPEELAKPPAKVAPKAPDPEVIADPTPTKPKQKNSAQDRIRQLAKEKNEALRLKQEAEDRLNETHTVYAGLEVTRLEKEVQAIRAKLQRAMSDGDADAMADAQIELTETTQLLNSMKQYVTQNPQQVKPKAQPKQDENFSQAAQDWMVGKEFMLDNAEYKALPAAQRKKLYPVRTALSSMVRELAQEGYSTEDYDFYEELDLRLAAKFDFYESLASMGLDGLELDENKPDEPPVQKASASAPSKPRPVEEKAKNVPVSGPSMSGSSQRMKSKKQVTLTKADMDWFENHVKRHGVTLQEYALSVYEERKNNPE